MKTRIKKSVICKDVENYELDPNLVDFHIPKAGDVGIFEIQKMGKHTKIQSDQHRHVCLMPGDLIMATFGTRYATGQFEGYVPDAPTTELHILGGGGTVGLVHSMHCKFREVGPTTLKLFGYAVNGSGKVINTVNLKRPFIQEFSGVPASYTKVILSIGSSMDSGKTTTAAHLVHGLKKQGKRVVYIKLTGTVYTKDADLAYDMGADMAIDFSHLGYPSTYLCGKRTLLNLYDSLLNMALKENPDYVIVEIADGLFQRETKMLLTDQAFMTTVDGVVFSAGDSLSALHGIQTLKQMGIIPLALAGLFTASPLLIQEVEENTTIPIFDLEGLRCEAAGLFTKFSDKLAV